MHEPLQQVKFLIAQGNPVSSPLQFSRTESQDCASELCSHCVRESLHANIHVCLPREKKNAVKWVKCRFVAFPLCLLPWFVYKLNCLRELKGDKTLVSLVHYARRKWCHVAHEKGCFAPSCSWPVQLWRSRAYFTWFVMQRALGCSDSSVGSGERVLQRLFKNSPRDLALALSPSSKLASGLLSLLP